VVNTNKLSFGEKHTPDVDEVLDLDYLNRATLGDKTLRTEVLGLFLAQVDAVQTQLSLPIDATGWTFLTHTLKGSAAAVGAKHIAALAKAWEGLPMPTTDRERDGLGRELAASIALFRQAAAKL
jgi:HPt (histidine-containing phosphotransfer) domain-containing protein